MAEKHIIPTPKKLYIYNDLPRFAHKGSSYTVHLLRLLENALKENPNVLFIDINEQIIRLATREYHRPFETTLALGQSGFLIAEGLHLQTGWFPSIKTIGITRQETAIGKYEIISTVDISLKEQLVDINADSIAIVDDTIYSGLTLHSILQLLLEIKSKRIHIFALQAITDTLTKLKAVSQISVGLHMDGRIDEEVSVIKASGLFEKGAIRRVRQEPLAFFEREEWMRAWFPDNAEKVIALAEQLYIQDNTYNAFL